MGLMDAEKLMWLALIAYFAYFINAAQFLIKFRLGRDHKKRVGQIKKEVAI